MLDLTKEDVLRRMLSVQRGILASQRALLEVSEELLDLAVIVNSEPTEPLVAGAKASEIVADGETEFPPDEAPQPVPVPQEPVQVELPSGDEEASPEGESPPEGSG